MNFRYVAITLFSFALLVISINISQKVLASDKIDSDTTVSSDKILTPDGYKDISDIHNGDQIIGYDLENNTAVINTLEKKEILTNSTYNASNATESNEALFTFYKINDEYELFRDQSVFANGELVHTSELEVGDTFFSDTNQEITIITIEPISTHTQWLKLTVSGNHTYYSDGILLHNASRFWVGGGTTNNWNAVVPTNWGSISNTRNNASSPGTSDAVIFDGIGFGASDSTISGSVTINSLDMTGYVNTLTHNSAIPLTISGDLYKLSSGMTYTLQSATAGTVFTSVTGTSGTPTTVTTNGKAVGNFTFNGTAGYFSLQDDLTVQDISILTVTTGTFDANNKNITTGAFASASNVTRTVTMGSGVWTLTGSGKTIWSMSGATGLTVNRGNDVIANYSGAVGTRTINTSNTLTEPNTVGFKITGGSDIVTVSQNVHNLIFDGFTGTFTNTVRNILGDFTITANSSTMSLASGVSTTTFLTNSGTKTITTRGKTLDFPIIIAATGGTLQLGDAFVMPNTGTLTFTSGNFSANDKDLTVGFFSSSNSNTRTLTMGTGTWTLTGNAGTIWTTSTSTGLTLNRGNDIIANYSGTTGTRTIAPSVVNGTEANSVGFKITAGSDILAASSGSKFHNLIFDGFTGTHTNATKTIYGNFAVNITSTTMTFGAGSSSATFAATSGTRTITTNGKTLNMPIIVNNPGSILQLADNLTTTTAFTLTAGSFDANNKNITVPSFDSSGASPRTLTMGSGIWTLTGNNTTIWTTQTSLSLTVIRGNDVVANYSGSVGTRTISVGTSFGTEATSIGFKFTGGTDTVVTATSSKVHNLIFDGFAGTLGNNTRTVYGSFIITPNSSGMTITGGSASTTLAATSGTKTITTSSKTIDFNLFINAPGGTYQLTDAIILGATRNFSITTGILEILSNATITANTITNSGTIIIDSGNTTVNANSLTNNGTITDNGNNMSISGDVFLNGGSAFTAPSGNLTISGDFTHTGGTFNHNSGTVNLDGINQTVSGDTTFNDFTKTVSSPDTLTFEDGSTQTIEGDTTFNGSAGNLLSLRSTVNGNQWIFDPQGARNITYVDVQDSNNSNALAIAFSPTITYGTNLTNWETTAPIVTPPPNNSSDSNDDEDNNDDDNECHDDVGVQPPWLYAASRQNSTSILLQFTEAADPVEKYDLEYGTKSEAYSTHKEDIDVDSESKMSYLVKDLTPNTTYYFRVRGVNGCANGDWSNELSTSTKSIVYSNNLQFIDSKLEPILPTNNPAGEPVQESNNEPELNTETQTTSQETPEEGYTVKVKVIDEQSKPVEGAKVTMHSVVQDAISDKDGMAVFNNVEKGDHKVIIAYNDYQGEEAINLQGEVKQFSLVIMVKQQNIFFTPIYLWSVGILVMITLGLLTFILRSRRT